MWRDRIRYRERVAKSRNLVRFSKFILIGVVLLSLFLFVGVPLLSLTLPSPDKIVRQTGFSTQIMDRNGEVLYDVYANQNRTPENLNDIPLYLRQATISIEDKNFYSHGGFDPLGILRGFLRIFTLGRAAGGSTLTQQLVKNSLLTSDRSLIRKLKEFVLAIEIERKYTKDQILQMYLNEVPYGGTAWGVGAAAETYFGKDVKDLDLVQSAILAGMPQSPSTYSPYSSTPKAYIQRTKDVLRRMREDGYITRDQEKSADDAVSNVSFQPVGAGFKAPHFVQYVQAILVDRYGQAAVEQGGLKVTTTLDYSLQQKAQTIVTDEITQVEGQHITNGAAIVMNPETGEILAMVGSKNFNDPNYDGQVNVTTALRQPGSSFKPFTYVTAFKEGYTPSTLLMDVPTEFPGGANNPPYKPVNYDGKFVGPIQIRFALGNSRNIPAVKMLAKVGIKDVLQTATDMGITTLPPTQDTLNRVGLSLTLGGGDVRLIDMANAYDAFVNKGFRTDPIGILKVVDANGKVLEDNHPQKGRRVLTEQQAFLVDSILSDNDARKAEFGTNSYLNVPGYNVMVKTGTTNDKRDNWTIGGNDNAMVGVWVGNNDNSPMLNVASGISGASPIWHSIILSVMANKPKLNFDTPSGITKMDVDSLSGYAAHDNFPSRSEYFIKGTEPGTDPVHVMLKVCKSDGKLATPADIASGNFDTKEYYQFKEEDPTAGSGQPNKWQEGILNWENTQSDSKYHPPSDYCGTSNPLVVNISNPSNNSDNLSTSSFDVTFSANSNSSIVSALLKVNGDTKCNYTNGSNNYICTVKSLSPGVYTIEADATDSQNHQASQTITVAVGEPMPTPTPSPTPTPVPSPI